MPSLHHAKTTIFAVAASLFKSSLPLALKFSSERVLTARNAMLMVAPLSLQFRARTDRASRPITFLMRPGIIAGWIPPALS